MNAINIAKEFSMLPGPRYQSEGDHSGEEFRERILRPRFTAAQKAGEKLTIDLDGVTFGYPTSFLEEAFGGLARIVGIDVAMDGLVFRSGQEPGLPDEIRGYIRDAEKTSRQRAKQRQA